MKIRVRDIAIRAGVSPATVSNALNGRPGVSQENAEKILHISNEMGYFSTKTPPKNTVEKKYVRLVMFKRHGLVVMDTQFFMELVESIERECRLQGYDLAMTHIHVMHDSDYRKQVQSICEEKCAGIIVLATEMNLEDLALFNDCVSPLLALDNLFRHEKVHSVAINNYEAGYVATKALFDAGHQQIGHITSNQMFNNMRYRRKGYEAVMDEKKHSVDENSFWRVTPTYDGAYEDMLCLLRTGRKPPTAFFAGNDIIAAGCVRALTEEGYHVPQDVSIIGMDDVQMCQICTPKLSTMRVYRREMGIVAVQTLLRLVDRMDQEPVMKTEISVSLIERESVHSLL